MELFRNSKVVRLRSHHGKYLTASEDEVSLCQHRGAASSPCARWSVELVEGGRAIRLKNCFGLYLAASSEPLFLGMTGRKVLQKAGLDPSVEWEPIRDGLHVRLRSHQERFLRANGGLPPWRNSVTHDVPQWAATQPWIEWDVDAVEVLDQLPGPASPVASRAASLPSPPFSSRGPSSALSSPRSPASAESSPRISTINVLPKYEGRTINYCIADEDGNVEEGFHGASFQFKGRSMQELTRRLEEEAGLSDVIVCSRNPLNGKLCPLRLPLPPNNASMDVVLVRASSRVARGFMKSEFPS